MDICTVLLCLMLELNSGEKEQERESARDGYPEKVVPSGSY